MTETTETTMAATWAAWVAEPEGVDAEAWERARQGFLDATRARAEAWEAADVGGVEPWDVDRLLGEALTKAGAAIGYAMALAAVRGLPHDVSGALMWAQRDRIDPSSLAAMLAGTVVGRQPPV